MKLTEEKLRKDFEDWLTVRIRHIINRTPDLSREKNGEYINPDHQRRWEAWKAAAWEYGP